MKVAIVGHGFVGKALEYGLSPNVEKFLVDPIYNTKISDLKGFLPNIIFICIPTPTDDSGSQNISILSDVINEITKLSLKSTVVIKSTVLPDTLINVEKRLAKVVYNPEFLREASANEDFIKSKLIVFGGNYEETKVVENFYKNFTKCEVKDYVHTDITTASFIKYTINTFLATKVTYFNELYNLFKDSGAKDSWENLINAISKDTRIGNSHMQVPGNDGKFGYGGACFPKDSQAFLNYSYKNNKTLELLKKSIKINKYLRNQE